MPYNYKSPGVYVEEVERGARPIEQAGTAVLAMVGFCREAIQAQKPTGEMVQQATPRIPTLVTNWTQFTNLFGDFDQSVPGGYLHQAMYGYFLNGGTAAFVVGLPIKVVEHIEPAAPRLPAGEGYLLNAAGARTVRIKGAGPDVSVEVQPPSGDNIPEGTFTLSVKRDGQEFKSVQNVTLARARGQRNLVDVLTKETDGLLSAEILDAPGSLAERMPAVGSQTALAVVQGDNTAVEPAPVLKDQATIELFRGKASERTGILGLEAIDEVTILACPDVMAGYKAGVFSLDNVKQIQTDMINHCESMKDRFAILDSPYGTGVDDMISWRKDKMGFDSKYAALYYPWVRSNGELIPPSGFVAGVYARVDGLRGVHKAPANEVVMGAIGLERNVSRNEQDLLNPIGVNCIRAFPGQGIRIWGARTLSSDARWRYINVRRLFSSIEESILQGTNWIVFEPNDQILWRQIKRDINAFLTVVWRSGALFGKTPEEAFYVKCDEETNPKELRDLGYCIIEVGLAPVKPAEFVVFKISQKEDNSGSANE
jgi:phage tail sheath protein FI